ncbi:MAG: DNA-binding protein [Planctomycetaceae bacterium]|nr:DNA-binding protein [Planctomycetaceae bacterium]
MSASASEKPPTKTQIMANIADTTELSKKQVAAVFDALGGEIAKNLGGEGPGQFTIPGLCKIVRIHKDATGPREVRNPRTGEMMMSQPKPARKIVRVRPLKALKDMV